ncbi:hypothetical protein QFZ62_001393 [Clavibacter sp. B3I6]|nr:hypothetical protein [Clavibacter sp. B3I6]
MAFETPPMPRGDDQRGRQHREEARRDREGAVAGDDEERRDDAREADVAEDRAERGGQRADAGREDREEGADAELPRAGEGGEVRDGRAGRGLVEAPRQRRDDEGADGEAHGERHEASALTARLGAAANERDHEDHQHGPDDVELLLHGEGPVVAERRDGPVGGEVVGPGAREVPVGDEERGPEGVPQARLRAHHVEDEERDGRGDHEHEERGRHDAADAALVEVEERDLPRALVLLEQQAGDEEPADDEEDVDADEAAGRPADEVVDDDGDDREGPQPLDVGAESAVHRDRRIPRGRRVLAASGGAQLRLVRERGGAPAKCLRAHGLGPN